MGIKGFPSLCFSLTKHFQTEVSQRDAGAGDLRLSLELRASSLVVKQTMLTNILLLLLFIE